MFLNCLPAGLSRLTAVIAKWSWIFYKKTNDSPFAMFSSDFMDSPAVERAYRLVYHGSPRLYQIRALFSIKRRMVPHFLYFLLVVLTYQTVWALFRHYHCILFETGEELNKFSFVIILIYSFSYRLFVVLLLCSNL